jgi:hypothetical protein
MTAGTSNPMREPMLARDAEALRATLAEDVVLHSPIIDVPFRGIDEVGDLYVVLLDAFEEFGYGLEMPTDDGLLFSWHAVVGGTSVEGVDIVRLDADGKVAELTVFMRPLAGVAAFVDATGAPLARMRVGRSRAALMRVLGPPGSMAMRMTARFAPRLLKLRG